MRARVAIVGGGVSGLHAAALLEARGIDFVLLEARGTFGGRVLSASQSPEADRFDLGGTWFWPEWQLELDALVRELGLEVCEQNVDGDTIIEPAPNRASVRVRGIASSPRSVRLAGGMNALVDALRRGLPPTRVLLDQRVRHIRDAGDGTVIVESDAASCVVDHVLLALPPRLAATTIEFTPALPTELATEWQHTATWMAGHAKYVAIYDEPFWRKQGLSGEARSAVGPLGEIHDASTPRGDAALFGFFGVPPHIRGRVSDDAMRTHCRKQLVRMFGPHAATPKAEFLKDWSRDPYTATAADSEGPGEHAAAPSTTPRTGPWVNRIIGVASEWSPNFPGYIAGAVDSARSGVDKVNLYRART